VQIVCNNIDRQQADATVGLYYGDCNSALWLNLHYFD